MFVTELCAVLLDVFHFKYCLWGSSLVLSSYILLEYLWKCVFNFPQFIQTYSFCVELMRWLTRGMMNKSIRTDTDGKVHDSVGHQTWTTTLSLDLEGDELLLIKAFVSVESGRIVHAACEPSDSADLHVNDLAVATWSRNRCVFREALLQLSYHKADERGQFVTTLHGSQWVARLSFRFVSNDFTWLCSVGIKHGFSTKGSRQARLTHLAI